jgi:hypothetical protein
MERIYIFDNKVGDRISFMGKEFRVCEEDKKDACDGCFFYKKDECGNVRGCHKYILKEVEPESKDSEEESGMTTVAMGHGGMTSSYIRDKYFANMAEIRTEAKDGDKEFSFDKAYKSLAKMQKEKAKRYGNSALKPLDIFAKHHPYGSRLDEKLARVKNSEVLRKNDVADIIGGCMVLCEYNGWEDFDDLID